MLTYDEVKAYHEDLLTENLKMISENKQTDKDVIFYNILKHAGMLYRYTADEELLSIFPSDSVVTVTELACDYIKDMTIVESIENILEKDILTDYDIENVENLLYFRDGLEMVLFMLTRLAKPLVHDVDSELLDILAKARSYAFTFDEVLRKRSDVYTVASRAGAYVKDYFKIAVNKTDFWWFYKAIEDDEKHCVFEEELLRLIHRKALVKKMAEMFKAVLPPETKKSAEVYSPANEGVLIHRERCMELASSTTMKSLVKKMAKMFKAVLSPETKKPAMVDNPTAFPCEREMPSRTRLSQRTTCVMAASSTTMPVSGISCIKCEFDIDNDPEHQFALKYSKDNKSFSLFVLNTNNNIRSSDLDGNNLVFTTEKTVFTSIIENGKCVFNGTMEMSELLIEIKRTDGTLFGTLIPNEEEIISNTCFELSDLVKNYECSDNE